MPQPTPETTPDGRFSYMRAGDTAAAPLVFLHGIGGAARAWTAQLDAFSADFHTVSWDMPGYGGSKALPEVSIATLAGALTQFLNELGLENPILVGHSIGGMIVQRYLADRGSARAVVLAQTSPAFGRPDGDWQREFIAARLGPLDAGATMAGLADELVDGLIGDDADPAGVALARACMASGSEQSYRAMMLALMGFDLREALPRIAVPTLVLSGSKDGNAPAPMMAKMAAKIPGAAYVEFEGCGHLAGMERPEAFNAALRGFLAESGLTKGN
ncbi:MAG: alpha/beta hydrolase [Chelatococcus sp.]|nr:MAG: alpha/beta hydrolase [Chelatococcus sp.]